MKEFSKIVCTDVYYQEDMVQAAALLCDSWSTPHSKEEYVVRAASASEYVTGEFYLRELPILIRLLAQIPEYDCVVVDAHVWLQEGRPGCGFYLWEHLEQKIPVIGVAKNRFHDGIAEPLLRGESRRPLYISAAGIDVQEAVAHIARMHGAYRMPTILKQVDMLSRKQE